MMDIDAIIAEATQNEVAPVQKEAVAHSEEAQETVSNAETNQESEDVSKKPDSELTPEQLKKREDNRQSHKNSREARIRRELREAKAELARLSQPQQEQQKQSPELPKIEDYDNLDTWVIATAEKLAEQKIAEQNKTQSLANETLKTQSRIQELANKEQEFATKAPDYERVVYQEHADLMNALPKHIAMELLEADNASLALYTLAKEGRLYDLEDMPPKRVAIELAKAEERGQVYLEQRKAERVTNAPAPISKSGRTTASLSPNILKMDARELVDWINS